MAQVLPDWPDPVPLLAELLQDLTASPVVGPRLYANFERDLPVIRVRVIGGTNSDSHTDNPRVVVDCFTSTYAAGVTLAGAARQRLIAGPHRTSSGDVLDRAQTEVRPIDIPYASADVHHFTAQYRLSLRR